MGMLYFVPARRFPEGRVPDTVKPARLTPEGAASLESLGLGHLDGGPLTYRGVRNAGPDGGAGLVIGLGVGGEKTGVFLDSQQWKPAEGGNIFLGWPTGEQPGPDTFLRRDALRPTQEITLADGKVWGFVATKALPTVLDYSQSGDVVLRARAQDDDHFEASRWLMEFALSDEERSYLDVAGRMAVCLGARYHLGLVELIALGLFETSHLSRVVFACLGMDHEDPEGKKKRSA